MEERGGGVLGRRQGRSRSVTYWRARWHASAGVAPRGTLLYIATGGVSMQPHTFRIEPRKRSGGEVVESGQVGFSYACMVAHCAQRWRVHGGAARVSCVGRCSQHQPTLAAGGHNTICKAAAARARARTGVQDKSKRDEQGFALGRPSSGGERVLVGSLYMIIFLAQNSISGE